MTQRRAHWIEKLQVQLAAVAGLVVVYFALWPMVRPWDPQSPVTFLPTAQYVQAGVLAAALVVLAIVCAATTVGSRPEGAILAALVATAGVALRSEPMRAMLWTRQDSLGPMFVQMATEIALLACPVLLAALAVLGVRRVIGAVHPLAVWRAPNEKEQAARSFVLTTTPFMAVAGVLSVVLLFVTMKSGDRGQTIFAMVFSFGLSVLVAHQFFPSRGGLFVWLLPVAVALLFYFLASVGNYGANWMRVPYYAQALPVDWLTAGGSGAVLGYWISARIHELRHAEAKEQQETANDE